jgi:hypothetical protein
MKIADRFSGVKRFNCLHCFSCRLAVSLHFGGHAHTTTLLVLLFLFPPLFLLSYLTISFFSFSFLPANSTDKHTRNIATQTKLLLLKEEV